MHLRKVPHISGPEYDPLWSVCEDWACRSIFTPAVRRVAVALPPNMKPALAAAVDAATKPVSVSS
jgi:hypothetical protein